MVRGKVALCVGATSGIGRAVAVHLAKSEANVVVAGRSKEAGAAVLSELKAANPNGSHAFIPCDASMMKNVKSFCKEFDESQKSLHYLVLTQGIATMKGRNETTEGIDTKLALHYYGRVQFIQSLLPLLSRTAKTGEDVRVMSILSAGVHSPYTKLDDMELKHNFTLANAASAAGFYNDLALDRLAADHPTLTFIHAAPGIVRTAWGTDLPLPVRLLVRLIQLAATAPETCAAHMCRALRDDAYRGGFRLVDPRGEPARRTAAHGDEVRDRVWAHTLQVLGRV